MQFRHQDLKLVSPDFGSELTRLIMELDFLRRKILKGSTMPVIFFQLKQLFHMLESIASARIEGNNTTIAEYIETKIDGSKAHNEQESYREIQNMEKAMSFIDENAQNLTINRALVSELHKMVVDGLSEEHEGDLTPGVYRTHQVGIKNSEHVPPPNDTLINHYMEELFEFINNESQSQFDLLKSAIAHHRFVWIHPFSNGNGRTVRLFTYALLIKQGFRVDIGQRILNPTAVFCSNRNRYYSELAAADTGTDEGLLSWCNYVLKGLKEEIEKVDKLLDYDFLKEKVLLPSLDYSSERKFITTEESKILRAVVQKQTIQAADVKAVVGDKDAAIISRQIKKLIEKQMLVPLKDKARKYTLRFDNNYLLRGIIHALDENSFLPDKQMKG
jgi:Fic family protein